VLFRRRVKPLGQRGEDFVVKHLKRDGYLILERNLELGRYEIDVVAQKGDTVAFVEVKTRRDGAIAPEESVGYTKRRHIRAAAHRYMAERDDARLYYRFDIASVLMPEQGTPTVTFFRDAFRDED
jgi:putative endonuclease